MNRAVMARTFGYLFAIAGTGGLVGLFTLQQSRDVFFPGIFLPCVVAIAMAVTFFTVWDRLPLWFFHVALALGIALMAIATFSDASSTVAAYSMTYIWCAVLAFSFFERRHAVLYVALIGVLFGLVLELRPEVTAASVHWARLVIAILVAGLVIDVLRKRAEVLVARLADVARTDSLTGLANRRAFEERFDAELERVRRGGGQLGLVLLDLDLFKEVNDSFGHEAGDEALLRLGGVLRERTRAAEIVARLGGEEFVALIPDATPESAYMLAERMRREVKSAFAAAPMRLTASCGVAVLPRDGNTLRALIRSADQALYAAKQLGRDRAVNFSPEIASIATAGVAPAQPSPAVPQRGR